MSCSVFELEKREFYLSQMARTANQKLEADVSPIERIRSGGLKPFKLQLSACAASITATSASTDGYSSSDVESLDEPSDGLPLFSPVSASALLDIEDETRVHPNHLTMPTRAIDTTFLEVPVSYMNHPFSE